MDSQEFEAPTALEAHSTSTAPLFVVQEVGFPVQNFQFFSLIGPLIAPSAMVSTTNILPANVPLIKSLDFVLVAVSTIGIVGFGVVAGSSVSVLPASVPLVALSGSPCVTEIVVAIVDFDLEVKKVLQIDAVAFAYVLGDVLPLFISHILPIDAFDAFSTKGDLPIFPGVSDYLHLDLKIRTLLIFCLLALFARIQLHLLQ